MRDDGDPFGALYQEQKNYVLISIVHTRILKYNQSEIPEHVLSPRCVKLEFRFLLKPE